MDLSSNQTERPPVGCCPGLPMNSGRLRLESAPTTVTDSAEDVRLITSEPSIGCGCLAIKDACELLSLDKSRLRIALRDDSRKWRNDVMTHVGVTQMT